MKTTSPDLIAFLNSYRPETDAPLCMADLFIITLGSGSVAGIAGGTVLAYCNADFPVFWNTMFITNSGPQFSGLKYKCSLGVNVDSQKMTISAWPSDTIGGIPFLQAIQQGLLDGAEIRRERAFFRNLSDPTPLLPIGTIILFQGRVSSVDQVGRTSAQVTVASDLTLLSIDMPRNIYSPNCNHVLFDSGCGLSRAAYEAYGSVTAASSLLFLYWSSATSNFQQGSLTFTSGLNSGVTVTVKEAITGGLVLGYPLPEMPAVGDLFRVTWGCDHTKDTCNSKFGNTANFKGFPYIPPPQIITGPLASYTPSSTKGSKL